MQTDNFDLTLKLLIVGDSSVGKTNFINRFTENKFDNNYMTTTGIDIKTANLQIKNKNIRIQIWDTAGQEKYRAITKNLFLKVMGAIIVFDVTNEKSFINLKAWIQMIKEDCGPHMQLIIVGNKCDLVEQRKINEEEIMAYAKEQKIEYIETSCKTGENVKKAVTVLCEKILDTKEISDDPSFILDSSTFVNPKKKKCC